MRHRCIDACRIVVLAFLCLGLGACSSGGDGGGGSATVPPGVGSGGGGTAAAPATITVTSPGANAEAAPGPSVPVTVSFTTQNFTIQDVDQPRLWIYLDDDPNQYTFVNGTTNAVLYNGAPSPDVQWVSPTSFRFNNLSNGLHTFRLALVNAAGTPLTNGEAGAARAFSVGVPFPTAPSIIPAGPAPNADVPGPVLVSFVIANHVSGLNGQPHMHFYIDGSAQRHEYFNGAGITEENGVQLNGAHTHAVHWKSPTSFMMYGWPPGAHSVRLVLADSAHNELGNPEATQTLAFNITSNSGNSEFTLETVVPNVNVRAIAFAPDGRAFYAVGQGQVWSAQTAGGTWQPNATPFYQTTVGLLGEQGLNGVVVDPNYASNGFVYIYYTTPDQQFNRVVRVTDVGGQATQETIIMDNLLAADQHNGGVLKFGPDGKLYVSVGEATQDFLSQDITSRHGKILRINGDGTFPPDNPFPAQGPAVWAYGIRNSYGMTFHPITNDLWITDNGPTVDDEVDLIVKGGNYGWPIATGTGTGPSGTLLPAAYVLSQPVGITNIVALAATPVYPTEYHNNLFFSDYVEGKIRRLVLDPTYKTVAADSIVFDGGNGALIALTQSPDGYMYVSGADGISRVITNPNTHQ